MTDDQWAQVRRLDSHLASSGLAAWNHTTDGIHYTRVTHGRGWRKSSYSSGENGNCVEVGFSEAGTVLARDTKQHRRGPVLDFSPEAFSAFVSAVKDGEFPVEL
ncbi:DUF397 domain-containing protein [Kitasatospora sp. NPDC094011]|uniref:DUF397 domain-containing protein n=1 Tax=Kitasatospora sp. NPDC094011 TaxID=3364090 RepID=UPI00381A3E59